MNTVFADDPVEAIGFRNETPRETLLEAARDQFGYMVGLARRNRLPRVGRIILGAECMGSITDDLNAAVRGAARVIHCESAPERLRVAAFHTLAEIADVVAVYSERIKEP